MVDAMMFRNENSQNKCEITTVTRKTAGIAIFADILKPTSKIPARRIGKNERNARPVTPIIAELKAGYGF